MVVSTTVKNPTVADSREKRNDLERQVIGQAAAIVDHCDNAVGAHQMQETTARQHVCDLKPVDFDAAPRRSRRQ